MRPRTAVLEGAGREPARTRWFAAATASSAARWWVPTSWRGCSWWGWPNRIFGVLGPGEAAFALLPLIVVINTSCGLYRRDELLLRKSTLDEAPAVFHAATLTTVVAFLLESVLLRTPMSAHLMAVTWLGLTSWSRLPRGRPRDRAPRNRARALPARRRRGHRRPAASKLLASPNVKATFVGLDPPGRTARDDDRPGCSGTPDELERVVAEHDVHRVIVAGDAAAHRGRARRHPARQGDRHAGQRAAADARGRRLVGRVRLPRRPARSSACGASACRASSRRVKRAFDVAGAALGLSLLAPLMVAIALASSSTSPGPVLFRQTRVGPRRHAFEMLKFRTMVDGADGMQGRARGAQRGRTACSRSPTTRASRASGASCGARRSTSCRSWSTSCAAR